ncbi:MAG: type IV toxin-antitoxin system AbiEi family antitoxin domain-containing protein [Elusimicrobiota bacterium]
MTLSEKEIKLINRLEYENREIYTREMIRKFYPDIKRADYLIKKLLEKRRLKTITSNTYLFIPMKAPKGLWQGNEYLIAKSLAKQAKYYIGYYPVFNSYGFTDQVSQKIYVINDKYSKVKTVFGVSYKFIKVKRDRLYGLEARKIKNEEVVFSSKERSLIDTFVAYDVKRAGHILAEQADKINIKKFTEYVERYPVDSVKRRIGYFLEKSDVSTQLLGKIKIGGKGYIPLYRRSENKGRINNRWKLIINE